MHPVANSHLSPGSDVLFLVYLCVRARVDMSQHLDLNPARTGTLNVLVPTHAQCLQQCLAHSRYSVSTQNKEGSVWGPSPQGKDPEVSEDTVSQLEGHPSPGRPP